MKKQIAGILSVVALCSLAGCGQNSTNNLGGATGNNPNDVYGSNVYWDGYGINTGRSSYYTEDRSSYGTPRANDKSFGQDVKRSVTRGAEDIKNAVENNPVTDTVRDAVDGNTGRNAV